VKNKQNLNPILTFLKNKYLLRTWNFLWIAQHFCAHHHVRLLPIVRHGTEISEISLVEEALDAHPDDPVHHRFHPHCTALLHRL